MVSRAENRVVNMAGLVQGITLVSFPVASSIFTDPSGYDLSGTAIRRRVPAARADGHYDLIAGSPWSAALGPAPMIISGPRFTGRALPTARRKLS
jgi:hypothetical protein